MFERVRWRFNIESHENAANKQKPITTNEEEKK